MTRVYVAGGAQAGQALEVPREAAHHLAVVVRVRVGDAVGIFDGRGREWRGRVCLVDRRRVVLDGIEDAAAVSEPPVTLTLAMAVLKGDQMDTVIRDATALGVARIIPIATDHVTVTPRAWQSGAARERWTRIAIASAQQCGRAVVPAVDDVTPLGEVWSLPAALTMACVEPAAAADASGLPGVPDRGPGSALLLVGPEGGWSAAEVESFRTRAVTGLGLGPRTLRAELAPIVAVARLWERWRVS